MFPPHVKRDDEIKNHDLFPAPGKEINYFGTIDDAPCVIYEEKPIVDKSGNPVKDLYSAWITLNNPRQYNSYTTDMVKGVIAGFNRASMSGGVVAAIFTAVGDKAFCTGGNTKEYAEYYSGRPEEYGKYMDLFNGMVDAILNCKKPTICRINGMRVAGGQEIGMACDLAVASDLALIGQAGPKHGSAPDGGSTDFLPWFLSMEDAMWNCISCEMWSAYKMKYKGLITKAVPVIKDGDKWLRNPLVITDKFIEDGEIVYGEFKRGEAAKAGKAIIKSATTNFELLDKGVDDIIWKFTNLFPGCLIKSIDGIRMKKKFFWDQTKLANRHWLAANMSTEALLGFNAFNLKRETGKDVIDFILYRQLLAAGHAFDEELIAAVLPKPAE